MVRRQGFMDRLVRLARYRLLVPLKRSRHTPEHSARGTAIGLAWACTPTFGIQMILVSSTWIIARRLLRRDFSLILGLAWTWACNPLTILPGYYLFYVTGRILLGHWDDISGYGGFLGLWRGFLDTRQTLGAQAAAMFDLLVRDWGLALWLGCLPWSALAAFFGYRWSLGFIRVYQRAKQARGAHRHGV